MLLPLYLLLNFSHNLETFSDQKSTMQSEYLTEPSLQLNPEMLQGNEIDTPAVDETSIPPESIYRDRPMVRLYSVCDVGVVKIHVPANQKPIYTDTTYIEDVTQQNALSSTLKKSNHDVHWPNEIHVDDPRNWPIWRKWLVTLIVSSISLCS